MMVTPAIPATTEAEDRIHVRAIRPEDVEACGRAAYRAHSTVAAAHNVPCEHPSVDFSIGLIGNKVKDANAIGFVAERGSMVIGSNFLNFFLPTPVAVIGPLTVDPAAEGGAAGRLLMEAALAASRQRAVERVRLVQSPSHLRSLALYLKTGFDMREPLILCSGPIPRETVANCIIRTATEHDKAACNRLCTSLHGFARESELQVDIARGLANVVERDGHITGYATGLGFRGHAAAETTHDLKALICSAREVNGPGFFAPVRNGELLRWLLERGFQLRWPATLMTQGPYQEPKGAFLPSIAF
jgi:ribosomal protein S18 acetylase RimI-like enzyme